MLQFRISYNQGFLLQWPGEVFVRTQGCTNHSILLFTRLASDSLFFEHSLRSVPRFVYSVALASVARTHRGSGRPTRPGVRRTVTGTSTNGWIPYFAPRWRIHFKHNRTKAPIILQNKTSRCIRHCTVPGAAAVAGVPVPTATFDSEHCHSTNCSARCRRSVSAVASCGASTAHARGRGHDPGPATTSCCCRAFRRRACARRRVSATRRKTPAWHRRTRRRLRLLRRARQRNLPMATSTVRFQIHCLKTSTQTKRVEYRITFVREVIFTIGEHTHVDSVRAHALDVAKTSFKFRHGIYYYHH